VNSCCNTSCERKIDAYWQYWSEQCSSAYVWTEGGDSSCVIGDTDEVVAEQKHQSQGDDSYTYWYGDSIYSSEFFFFEFDSIEEKYQADDETWDDPNEMEAKIVRWEYLQDIIDGSREELSFW